MKKTMICNVFTLCSRAVQKAYLPWKLEARLKEIIEEKVINERR